MKRIVLAFWSFVESLATAALLLLVAVMVIACLAQVITRYLIAVPLTWSEEVARFSFIWSAYLSAWLAWKHRAHIAIDLVHYVDSRRLQRLSGAMSDALVVGLCVLTFSPSLQLVTLTWPQASPILGVPMGLVYAGYIAMIALIAGDILIKWIERLFPEAVSAERN